MSTGQRIRERRKQLALSAETIARQIGVSPATVYRWEKGDIEKVPTTIIAPLSSILQISPQYLMELNDDLENGWNDDPEKTTSQDGSVLPIPQTPEARILASGIDRMPQDEREKALTFVRLMFDKYFSKEDE